MRDAIPEIETCLLNQAAAKLEAKWFAEDLLGLSHAEDCAEHFHGLRAVGHQVGNIDAVGFEDVTQRVFNLRREQVRRHDEVPVKTRMKSPQEYSFVTGWDKPVVADDGEQVAIRRFVVVEDLLPRRLNESINTQRPVELRRVGKRFRLKRGIQCLAVEIQKTLLSRCSPPSLWDCFEKVDRERGEF